MKVKNRKGIGINWYITLAAVFLGFVAWAITTLGPHKEISNYIGYYQFTILKVSNNAEKALFYTTQSAKYSLQQSVYDLAQYGGFIEIAAEEGLNSESEGTYKRKCGSFQGYSIWYELENTPPYSKKSCIDKENIKLNLEYLFNQNLNQYLLIYPENLPLDNYNYEIKGSLEMIGKSIVPLKFNILKDESKQVAEEAVETKIETTQGSKNFKDFTGTKLCAKGSTCLLTEEAFKRLEKANEIAEEKGVSLEVYSAYRSKKKQIDLWEGKTPERYAQRFPNEMDRRAKVCYPYGDDVEKRCPHLTGDTIDVRLKNKKMTAKEWKILKDIMASVDKPTLEPLWVKYMKEPWHFECCSTDRYTRAKEQGVTEIV